MSEPMCDGDGDVGKLRRDIAHDLVDFFFSHWSICIVEDRLDRAAFMMIAHDTFEEHIRAVAQAHHAIHECARVDRRSGQVVHPPATGGMNASSSPSRSSESGEA